MSRSPRSRTGTRARSQRRPLAFGSRRRGDYRPAMTSIGPKEAIFPAALIPFASRVERRIDDLLTAELHPLAGSTSGSPSPSRRCAVVATGGKRFRPAFCYCAFVGANGDEGDPRVVDAAAALGCAHVCPRARRRDGRLGHASRQRRRAHASRGTRSARDGAANPPLR